VATTVVIRQLTEGSASTRILDALDAVIDAPSDRLSNGRRYSLEDLTNRTEAVAQLEAHLDRISSTWSTHVTIHGIA
jgi:hypothetical protein